MKTNEFTYKVMDLNTAQLEIPRETYQRELSPDRVRRIVKAFDERIANEPKVSYRGGHYYVFDGQHTIAARNLPWRSWVMNIMTISLSWPALSDSLWNMVVSTSSLTS